MHLEMTEIVIEQHYCLFTSNFNKKRKSLTLLIWAFFIHNSRRKTDWLICNDRLPNSILKVKPSYLSNRMFFFENWIIHIMEINGIRILTFKCHVFLKCPVGLLAINWHLILIIKPITIKSKLLSVSSSLSCHSTIYYWFSWIFLIENGFLITFWKLFFYGLTFLNCRF